MNKNIDSTTVDSFGDEWSDFDQKDIEGQEAQAIFNDYFAIFPWDRLAPNAEGFDMGCGSGRWARLVAPKVGHLHCIDPSRALDVAKRNLAGFDNVSFHSAGVDDQPVPSSSQDFGYSLGVLHHIPDTAAALRSCTDLLKPGAPFLLYLYYAFDNRPLAFQMIWKASELGRSVISHLPSRAKRLVTDTLAGLVYWPLARLSLLIEKCGIKVGNIPLSYYRNHSFYTMRTDSRDRFGTPLEQRFTRQQITDMMQAAGLEDITFSESAPFWCACGIRQA